MLLIMELKISWVFLKGILKLYCCKNLKRSPAHCSAHCSLLRREPEGFRDECLFSGGVKSSVGSWPFIVLLRGPKSFVWSYKSDVKLACHSKLNTWVNRLLERSLWLVKIKVCWFKFMYNSLKCNLWFI